MKIPASRPRFYGSKFVPVEAGAWMTVFIPHSEIRIP